MRHARENNDECYAILNFEQEEHTQALAEAIQQSGAQLEVVIEPSGNKYSFAIIFQTNISLASESDKISAQLQKQLQAEPTPKRIKNIR